MIATELLQQIGLNKYEAEAYFTLLSEGPLTGYELGKRSQVPLSRSYEILERLTSKGLALVQPGDPPRYVAEDPGQFLQQVRTTMEDTLSALARTLTTLARPDASNEFWVIRGQQHILQRAQMMIARAQKMVNISLRTANGIEMIEVLAKAQARGCHVFRQQINPSNNPDQEAILLLIDDQEVLVGTLAPLNYCQAVVSANPALLSALRGYFARHPFTESSTLVTSILVRSDNDEMNWLEWENRKQRRLWRLKSGDQVA